MKTPKSMTSAKAKYFEAKIEESQKPQVKLREWDDEPVQPPIPEHKSSGESSAAGLKAKFGTRTPKKQVARQEFSFVTHSQR